MILCELGLCPPAQGSHPLPQPGAELGWVHQVWGEEGAGPRIPRKSTETRGWGIAE